MHFTQYNMLFLVFYTFDVNNMVTKNIIRQEHFYLLWNQYSKHNYRIQSPGWDLDLQSPRYEAGFCI
jgi:hypothetical protein